jgi:hypothetical protein
MSMPGLPTLARPRRDWAVPAAMLVAIFFLLIGGNLAGNGALNPISHTSAVSLPGWEDGSLLRVLVLWVASWLVFIDANTALMLVYVLMASVGAFLAYRFLRVSDWPAVQAFVALALVASHGMLIYATTTASAEFLILLATAALIPAQRRLEAVGDVQSIINYGLTLPLLLMAGPPLAALIPLLVLAVPFREAEARRKPQVFAAMLLVAFVPTLIIITGVLAMAGRAGIGIDMLVQPFAERFVPVRRPVALMMALLAATAPVALVLIVHGVIPDRRRKPLTTLIALALPLYLAIGNSLFDWRLAPWTPAAAMMMTGLGWLCTTRVRPWMRWLILAMLAASSLASWLLARLWADPAWLDGLLPIRLYGLNISIPGLG